jgi:hypothetical protein
MFIFADKRSVFRVFLLKFVTWFIIHSELHHVAIVSRWDTVEHSQQNGSAHHVHDRYLWDKEDKHMSSHEAMSIARIIHLRTAVLSHNT